MEIGKTSPKNKKLELKKENQEFKGTIVDLERYIEEFTAFLPISICITSPIGVIVNINEAFQDLSGFQENEIIGKSEKLSF